ncbi:MAG: nicotinate (nicotinamide) nucleotide adenylyltransferase [Treponema sp.]|jgi:nicotinate-nucleotide adenylyltransferase|nr:nicotinate (nicotinamide) nucleotide adenylyltransferase [Treponema sp.]
MKLAVLGGSFNPIHLGHLYLADTVLSILDFDRVLLVPAHTSPFKPETPGASPRDRLDMVLASVAASPRLGVDDLEMRRGGISYTADTLEEIIKQYRPEGKPALILGDDLAKDFAGWKRAAEIAERAELIIARRVSDPSNGRPPSFPFPCTPVRNEIMEISSAMVRDRIGRGGAWRSLVPQGARFIIEERGLYQNLNQNRNQNPNQDHNQVEEPPPEKQAGKPQTDGGPVFPSLLARVEDTARSMLKPSRFLHSRGTALLTRDLALALGMDGNAAYLAGIAHDMGKALAEGELFALAKRDGKPISRLERKKPALLHGRAAAVLLRERFGVHNGDILEAVALHTSGGAGMGILAQVLFIADKIEFSRKGVDNSLRERAAEVLAGKGDFPALFRAVLEDNVRYLRSKTMEVSEKTLRILELLKQGAPGAEKHQA